MNYPSKIFQLIKFEWNVYIAILITIYEGDGGDKVQGLIPTTSNFSGTIKLKKPLPTKKLSCCLMEQPVEGNRR